MAVFTAIATAIVSYAMYGTIAVTAFAAGSIGAFAVSVVATGLAYATARLINGTGARGGGAGAVQDQGVRVQLPPATDNKIPILYGRAFQQGIITDARISNENKTMTYVLVLGERTTSGTYTVNDIYWNDQKLVFNANGYTVDSSILSDGTSNTKLASKVRMWVYAGGSGSAYQIKGPSPAVNAYDNIPGADSTYAMSDLVFTVIQLDYDAENGITALPAITFDITNSLKNPGDVWVDYMTNTRYGCGISSGDLDLDSATGGASTSLKSISNEIPANQFQSDGTTPSTQVRYEINGVLSTADTLKTNIDKINLASSSWTTFDHKKGKWRVVVNRAASVNELANAFVFSDDNIIGEITLTATNLEDLYNEIEVAYANRGSRDQSDYYKDAVNPVDLNSLEPKNILRMRTDLCNNALHAGRIGKIELRQSRVDLIVSFMADYSALQVEAGDVVKVTNPIYAFSEKPFRVVRVRETEGQDGTLVAEITALEYSASIYTDSTLVDGPNKPTTDIPTSNTSASLPPPSTPVISNVNATANTPNFRLATTISTSTSPVNLIEWFYSNSPSGTYSFLDNDRAAGTTYAQGATVYDIVTNLVEAGTWYFKARTGINGSYSALSGASAALVWNPQPAGANNGTINTSTDAQQVFVSDTASGVYTLVLTTGTNEHLPLYNDADLTYSATSNKMYIKGWEVSTVTNAIYGQFIATGTQSIATATSIAAVTFDESVYADGITLSNGSRINLPSTGQYYLQFSTQFANTENNAYRALMWLRKNGNDEIDSNTVITVPARHGNTDGTAVMSVGFLNEHQANDYVELYWNAENAGISLKTISSSTVAPIYPRAPAVILSVHKVVGAP